MMGGLDDFVAGYDRIVDEPETEVRANGAAPLAEAEPLETIDPASWDGRPIPERKWVFKDFVPAGEPMIINGHGAAGKTLLGCQLGVRANFGSDCVGFLAECSGPVLIYSAEESEAELHRRLSAILAHLEKRFSDFRGFRLYCVRGAEAALSTVGRDGLVKKTNTLLRLEATVKYLKPVLVEIDAVANVFIGSEIDRSVVVQNVGIMKELASICDSAVVAFQHVSVAGMNSDDGTSGSTGWHNHVRARALLKGVNGDDKSDLRELVIKKQNYAQSGQKVSLQWRRGVLVPYGGPSTIERAAAEAPIDETFLRCLDAAAAQGRAVSDSGGRNFAPTVFEEMPEAKGFKGPAFRLAMARLFSSRRIKVETYGPPSKQRTRLVRVSAERDG